MPPGTWLSVRGSAGAPSRSRQREQRVNKVPAFGRWAALSLRSYLLLCSLVYKNMGGLLQQKAYSQQSALSSLPNGLAA